MNVDRAIRAARQIRRRVTEDNSTRRLTNRVAPCVRIGIHTGDALVGNIGAPGRINYTLVGDAVNVAARLEQLSKSIGQASDAKILISDATAALAEDRNGLVSVGTHEIRGRDGTTGVWSLDEINSAEKSPSQGRAFSKMRLDPMRRSERSPTFQWPHRHPAFRRGHIR